MRLRIVNGFSPFYGFTLFSINRWGSHAWTLTIFNIHFNLDTASKDFLAIQDDENARHPSWEREE